MKFILFPPGLIKYPTAMHPWEHGDIGVKDVVRVVKAADALGYDYVNMPDHIVISSTEAEVLGPQWPEVMTSLAFFAGITERIGLYTSVLVVPYRSPYLLAKAFATIDWLSGGRVALAVGAGHAEDEFDVLGIPFKERGAITDEYLRAMKVLWTEEVADFTGTYVNFSDMVCSPHPVQKAGPPIYIGGNSKAAMRRAARIGDGWHPWTVSPEDLPACIEYIYEQPELRDNPRPFEIIMPMARLNVDDVTHKELGETHFPTSTEEVLDEIGNLRDLGSTGILTYFAPTSSLEEYLDRIAWFAEEIMPQYRD
jgi:probable F420-dependent oxidoreductase